MIGIPNPKKLLEQALNNIRHGMNVVVYSDAQNNMDLSERYRRGDQMPENYRGNPKMPMMSLVAVESDLQRLTGMASAGIQDVRFYGNTRRTMDLIDNARADFETWQSFERYSNKIGFATYRNFEQGFMGVKLSINPLERVGDDLPRIAFDIPDGRQWVIDPTAKKPHEEMMGGRWVAVWEPITVEELAERYQDTAAHKDFIKARKLGEIENTNLSRYETTPHAIGNLNPLRAILRNLVIAEGDEFPEDAPTSNDYSLLASLDYIQKIALDLPTPDGTQRRSVKIRLHIVSPLQADKPDPTMKHAVLLDAQILNYDGLSPLIIQSTDPPYGLPIVALAKSSINQTNFLHNAVMAMILQMVRQGQKKGIIKNVWDDKQRVSFERNSADPDTYLFDADKFMEAGIPVDVNKVITDLSVNFPQLSDLIAYSNVVEEKKNQAMNTPWSVTGAASPATRASGASISLMQDAVRLSTSIVSAMVKDICTEVARAAFAMMKRHWISEHRIINKGLTSKRMNVPVANPITANLMLNRGVTQDGEVLQVNAIAARFNGEGEGAATYRVYPIDDSVKDVLDDPVFQELAERDDVDQIAWIANSIEVLDVGLEILVEIDADKRDSDNMKRIEFMAATGVQVSPEVVWENVMGPTSNYTYDENVRMRARNQAMETIANLTDEELASIFAIIQQQQQLQEQQPQQQGAMPMTPTPGNVV